ncbi:MAG: Peptide chain release factor RF-2 [Parcubacteria group bacterium GW2011_GWA2_47_16]|nr:MAG: Peptide chain release factor RF-2 [Parcubacteria group bacterium GW2011_GWA2_47_16]
MDAKEKKGARIKEIEEAMNEPDFWSDKNRAQAAIKELQTLKTEISGGSPYDAGDAVMTIFSGAGGDDAEDFSAMLFNMYRKYFEKEGWVSTILHQNDNDHGGFRNITMEIHGPSTGSKNSLQAKLGAGKGVYGTLKNESGVHRLVRISPFNAKKLRHTSFSMVEVIPKFEKTNANDFVISEKELEISIARSGGPGGQNVNKRETAVRIVHIPTKLSVHVTSERSQQQNKEKAIDLLRGKLWKLQESERIAKEKGMYISKSTSIEWGNQIRSYVLHPYKMVKDHRTEVEVNNPDAVLNGELDEFIEAERGL